MKHILICGDKGAGKSTLISRLLEETGLPVSGFVTKRLPSGEDGFHPIYIHPAGEPEEQRRREEENCIGTCNGRIHNINLQTFDTVGAALIKGAAPGSILVMDELGFMEAGAVAFTKAVFDALDGDIPVLAAVKSRRDIPFLEKLRSHPKTEVWELTPQTREEVFEQLLAVLRRQA